MTVVSMSFLLEAGVHFGHQTKRWNPKMKEYIYTARDDIYIIDLQKTAKMIEEAYAALKDIAAADGKVLFVGTRKQAQEAIKEESTRVGMYHVTERWLGGTLTNFKTIRRRVKRLEEIEKMEKDGMFELLPKKEVIGLRKEYEKLNKVLSGIREMQRLPQALFIVDPSKEAIAIAEARKLKIPVFGIVDTNCDPDMVDYVIPANDDAIRAVKLIVGVMANAVAEATGKDMIDFVTEEDKKEVKEVNVMEKVLENTKKPTEKVKETSKEEIKAVSKEEVKEEVKVVEKKEVKKAVAKVDLSTKTVAELRELAKEKNIKGYTTLKKAELLEALK